MKLEILKIEQKLFKKIKLLLIIKKKNNFTENIYKKK